MVITPAAIAVTESTLTQLKVNSSRPCTPALPLIPMIRARFL